MGFSELRKGMKKLLFTQKDALYAREKVGATHGRSGANGEAEPSLRILHLEDNANDAQLVAMLLRQEEFKADIERVETRNEFLSALKGRTFDVILSDFSLPAFDGKTALSLAREKCPGTPFLFVSGTLGEDAAIESLKN